MGLFNFGKKKEESEKLPPGTGKVKYIIAVASGKGGVGKSTVSTNLAVSLAQKGFKVGLMDADLYGPSQPGMMGHRQNPKGLNGAIIPEEKFGVKFISMGSLNPGNGAMVVRAPLAIKAIQQFLVGVLWGELDYLMIDLPPGTGDIQLTLAQQARLNGAVIVTTPQKVATEVAQKGLDMFNTVSVPILGVIENMSGYVCTHCGEESHIFQKGGGEEMATNLNVPFLGKLPLDPEIMMGGDEGGPLPFSKPQSKSAQLFSEITDAMIKNLNILEKNIGANEPETMNVEDGILKIKWKDKGAMDYRGYDLRISCPCASCVDENTGKRILNPNSVSLDIKIAGARPVGRYGVALNFSDGHNTGIFKFVKLMELKNKERTETFSV